MLEAPTRNLPICLLPLVIAYPCAPIPAAGGQPWPSTIQSPSRLELPITLCGPVILMPASVNGSDTLWFQLDTGFENSVIDPQWVGPLKLKAGPTSKVSAPGGSVERATVTGATLRLQDLEITDQMFSAIDIAAFGQFFGHRVDGILGFDFLSRFVVAIDYGEKRIALYNPGSFKYKGPGTVVPIDLSSRQPYVQATVRPQGRAPASGRFEIDTGSMDVLTLNTPFADAHQIPAPGARTLLVRGRSLGGETTGLLTRMEGLDLAGVHVPGPITGIVRDDVDRAGQISGELLRRFHVIFDYSRRVMILEKTPRSSEPFETDMAGLLVVAGGERLEERRVFLVVAGSPAEQCGLRAGDTLISIDGIPAAAMSLDEIRWVFKRKGERRELVVQRGPRILRVGLTLRRLL